MASAQAGQAGAERERRLAFVYHPQSFGTMAIAEAARGVCRLIWVIDGDVPETASMARLLRRLGDVVDIAGLSLDDASAAIAAQRPDGILALADSLLGWTAAIALRLELPFISPAAAAALTDKHAQREALRAAGVAVPGFWPLPPLAEAEAWTALERRARFPAVLKPRRGEGSRDVVPVQSLDQVRAILEQHADLSLAGERGFILEEYLRDRVEEQPAAFAGYVSVESIVAAGRISHLAITGRFPLAEPFRETGFFIPSALERADRDAVLELASAAIAALGVSIGCLHTEIKLTPDGPRVIELNGRIGGGVPEMLLDATGIDLLEIALRLALSEAIAFDAVPACSKVGYLLYVQAPPAMRTVTSVNGLDTLRADAAVEEVILRRGPGQSVDWREGNHGHVFSVRGAVGDHAELKQIQDRVYAEAQILGD
jgi:biotin carboxylase